MAKFKQVNQIQGQSQNKDRSQGQPPIMPRFEIVEPRCKVCMHPNRREIDMMIALGWSQADVLRHWNYIMELQGFTREDFLKPNSMSLHVRKHLSIKDAAIRRIIEARARAEGLDIETVEGFILTKQGIAEALIAAGLESMHRGDTVVEPKDVLTAIKIISELEADRASQAEEVMLNEIRAFTRAVKRVVPEDQWKRIYELYEEELGRRNMSIMPPKDVEDVDLEADLEDNLENPEENPDQLRLF